MGWLSSLIVRIKGDNKELKTSLNDSEKSVSSFGSGIKKLGGLIAAAFSIQVIKSFTQEMISLAAKAEGVRQGFDNLNAPGLLTNLRTATRGTVTDLELMQRAVMAKNFKIPLSQLATYFEFATKRATQTGQSVDYLVDSIVTGIGRKSVLVMDNLGISAVELQQEVEKVGDFGIAAGNIIRRELESMGDVADTTATKIAKISTAWENIKTGVGGKITESPMFQGLLTWVDNIGKFAQMPGMSLPQAIYGATFKPKEFNGYLDESNKVIAKNTEELLKNKEASERAAVAKSELAAAWSTARGNNAGKGLGKVAVQSTRSTSIVTPELEGLQGANIALEREMTIMEDILTSGRDMAFELGTQVIESIGEALSGGNIKDLGKGLLMSLASFLSQFGKLLIIYGLGLEAFVTSSGTFNPVPALIAGTAMLVAAGAIRGLVGGASRGVSSSGGGGGAYSSGAGMQAQNMKVEVVGRISGKDLVISSKRYMNE